MQIILTKSRYSKQFIYNYLYPSIKKLLLNLNSSDEQLLNQISLEQDDDYLKAYQLAVKSLKLNETDKTYEFTFSKSGIYKGKNYEDILNTITYGSIGGTKLPIVYDIFEWVANNALRIYEEWKRGIKII